MKKGPGRRLRLACSSLASKLATPFPSRLPSAPYSALSRWGCARAGAWRARAILTWRQGVEARPRHCCSTCWTVSACSGGADTAQVSRDWRATSCSVLQDLWQGRAGQSGGRGGWDLAGQDGRGRGGRGAGGAGQATQDKAGKGAEVP